jgi:signal transduction histidine kinase
MSSLPQAKADYRQLSREWAQRMPWYRRLSAQMGLQGKLVLVFMWLLMMALGSSLWLYVSETRSVFWHVMGEHAIEVSHTLGMASEQQLVRRDVPDLDRIAKKILKNPDIAAIGFYDASGLLLTVACTDPEIDPANPQFLGGWKVDTQKLLHVQHGHTPALGRFVYSTVPVVQLVNSDRQAFRGKVGSSRLVGYVTVAITQADDEARLATVRLLLVAICAVVVLLSLPLVSMLVHRIFSPIRQLVVATDRMANGDLSARVAVHRPDVIGNLARSFNEMVIRVKQQQDDLAFANGQLALANTQLAEANTQLADSNRDLEERVRIRTVELEAANRRLSSEISDKEEFLRAVSHDLTAPLRNIAGMASMLLMKNRQAFDEDTIHRLERIQKNVEIETGLIEELLELSRIKTRRQKTELVDPVELINELAGMFDNDFKTHGISLHINTELPQLQVERARFRQVFQNLIDNAIKYMGKGPTREIRIGCHLREGEVEFYVSDSGVGIDAEDLPRVFQVFRRGRTPAVQEITGKGIGLASVKSIIETYNGTIWVESRLGEGTTFRFTINGQFLARQQTSDRAGGIFIAA